MKFILDTPEKIMDMLKETFEDEPPKNVIFYPILLGGQFVNVAGRIAAPSKKYPNFRVSVSFPKALGERKSITELTDYIAWIIILPKKGKDFPKAIYDVPSGDE